MQTAWDALRCTRRSSTPAVVLPRNVFPLADYFYRDGSPSATSVLPRAEEAVPRLIALQAGVWAC